MRPNLELKVDWDWENALNSMNMAKLKKKFSELLFHVYFIPNESKFFNLPATKWICHGCHYRRRQLMST